MENKLFYTAIKNTVDYCEDHDKKKPLSFHLNGICAFIDSFMKYGVVDFEDYYEEIDYKKIFLKSYYDLLFDVSFSLDMEGRETMQEEKTVAFVMDLELQKMDETKALFEKYYFRGDMTVEEHNELLKKHDLV